MHGSDLWEFEIGGQMHVLAAVRPGLWTKMHVARTESDSEVQALWRTHWRAETVQYEQEMWNAALDPVMA
jgi:hypothetical protein